MIAQTHLQRGTVVPNLRLPRCDGGPEINLRALKPRFNLVLLFAHDLDCQACREAVEPFAAERERFQALQAALVVVARGGSAPREWQGVTLLCDPQGAARGKYLAGDTAAVGLFVTDRWQSLRRGAVGSENALPTVEQVLDLLAGIESECPECSPIAEGWEET